MVPLHQTKLFGILVIVSLKIFLAVWEFNLVYISSKLQRNGFPQKTRDNNQDLFTFSEKSKEGRFVSYVNVKITDISFTLPWRLICVLKFLLWHLWVGTAFLNNNLLLRNEGFPFLSCSFEKHTAPVWYSYDTLLLPNVDLH